MEASTKYTNCSLDDLKAKFPKWDDKKIFEVHDLFQAFEVDGDGLIEIAEMYKSQTGLKFFQFRELSK